MTVPCLEFPVQNICRHLIDDRQLRDGSSSVSSVYRWSSIIARSIWAMLRGWRSGAGCSAPPKILISPSDSTRCLPCCPSYFLCYRSLPNETSTMAWSR